ncbi:MAG: hypothetical protein AAFQ13_04040 [Pseudomonadota bacterium]
MERKFTRALVCAGLMLVVSTDPAWAENPGRVDCPQDDRACQAWSTLLGDWTNPEFGGTIEFRLQNDGTVSAYVKYVSEEMRKNGYREGMHIARGLNQPKATRTWSFSASNSEVYNANIPKATGGLEEQGKWISGGVFFIKRAEPGVLYLPASLSGGISKYKGWVRPGTTDECPTTNTDCRNFDPVLGVWGNARYGGTIEFREDADGTLSGFVVTANSLMQENGFEPGMQILRGLRLAPARGTRSFWADRGEWLSPKRPDAAPGERYGSAEWNSGAQIYIQTAKPGVIKMPSGLSGRLGNYTDWIRAD